MCKMGVRSGRLLRVTGVFRNPSQSTAGEIMFRGLFRQSILCLAHYLIRTVLVLWFQIRISFKVSLNLGLMAMHRVLEMVLLLLTRGHLRALSDIGMYKIMMFIQLEVVSLFLPSERPRALSINGIYKITRIIQLGLSQLFLQFEQGLLYVMLRDQCKCCYLFLYWRAG
jgi:hypothetical protein